MAHRLKLASGSACALSLVLVLASCNDSSLDAPRSAPTSRDETGLAHSHDTPAESCFICDQSKREAGRLWCAEHSRYEDRCWLCHPELQDADRLYCNEHGVYEDECFLCHPGLQDRPTDDGDSEDTSSLAPPKRLFCNEHRVPEEECGICQPQRAGELLAGDELKVRFESPQSASKAGIRTVPARSIEAGEHVDVFCEVVYNANALARITPLAFGLVREVLVDVGADVQPGDVLVEIHSAEVAEAKSAFVSAVVDLNLKEVACQRERHLAEKRISSEKELQEADAACKTAELTLSASKQRLLNYGITEDEVKAIKASQDTSAVMNVRAPYAGTLVERTAVVGEAVKPGESLFTLADLDSMWLSLSIPADQVHLIEPGLAVEAAFDGGAKTRGEITWVSPIVDEKSRMLPVRALVDNTTRRLKAGMFGTAQVVLSADRSAVGVPVDSLQYLDGAPYVFVKVEDDLYSLRRVALLGIPSEHTAVIIDGLLPDEPVVADGAFTVMSEFLKSRLGAGCVDD